MTSPLMKSYPFRAPLGPLAADRPGPAVYTAGPERLVVSFAAPDALSVVYVTPNLTISTRSPLPFANLRPATGNNRPVVALLELTPAMRMAVQGELLATTRPADPQAARFFEAQRMIFVDSFTCDPLDEDSIVRRPT